MKLKVIEKHIDYEAIPFTCIITVLVVLFILIGHIYPKKIQSVLKEPIIKVDSVTFDWWSVTHFGFFAVLGYLFPFHIAELTILGIIWEIIEDALSPSYNTKLINCNKKYEGIVQRFKMLWCDITSRDKDYWYGKWDDIFANSLGLIVGQWLRFNHNK